MEKEIVEILIKVLEELGEEARRQAIRELAKRAFEYIKNQKKKKKG